MSIRKGSSIIAGTGGTGNSDYLVNQNISSPITKIYDWIGTLEEYTTQDIQSTHPEWLCFITDDAGSPTPDKGALYTSRNAGDIFFTSRLDTQLNGAVECNGGIYNVSEYTGKDAVPSLLRAGKLPYITTAEYALILAEVGNVGVFGWDGINADTFRVPTISNLFIEAGQANKIGDYIAPGLPNITGEIHTNEASSLLRVADNSYEGAFAHTGNVTGTGNLSPTGSYEIPRGINFDASRSSSLYGASSTVQPKAVKYRPMIQLSVGFSDEAVETCQELKDHAVKDTDLATLLQTIYPVGSVYMGTQSTCPMATVIAGSTWELVSNGRALWTGNGSNANTTIEAGLPNITGYAGLTKNGGMNGAFYEGNQGRSAGKGDTFSTSECYLDASRSSSIYGRSSTVQPPAYVVNVWRRTA